jgi:GNAT superfamily N-acetyltransferase
MQFERFDAASDSQRLGSCYEIFVAAQRVDDPGLPDPSLPSFRHRWTPGFRGLHRETWLGVDDAGVPVGCYMLTLPDKENRAIGWCVLAVAPDRRRLGAGRALLEHCAGRARLAGRVRLAGEARAASPGSAFAAAAGERSGIAEVFRRLDIDAGVAARIASLKAVASPHAAGYSLVSWVGASPADSLADQALIQNAMADAPRDAGVEPETWDAERIHELERTCFGSGQQFYSVAGRHEASGRLVALTQVYVEPGTPGWAFQMDTAVLPEHRGHRLGLLVKIAMLDLLAVHEPGVRRILTGNAASNEHMIAINEELGFTPGSVYQSWELDLAAR